MKPTAADIRLALKLRWPDERRFLHIPEAPIDAARSGSRCDLLVISAWMSDGHELDAIEIKTSYQDWKREWESCDRILHYADGTVVTVSYTATTVLENAALYSSASQNRGLAVHGGPVWVERVKRVDVGKSGPWRKHAHRWWIAAPSALAEKIALDVKSTAEMSDWGVLAVDGLVVRVLVKPVRQEPEPLAVNTWVGLLRAYGDARGRK